MTLGRWFPEITRHTKARRINSRLSTLGRKNAFGVMVGFFRSKSFPGNGETVWAWPECFAALSGQRESGGAVPLAIIIRLKITAAIAVAARIVKNQKSRLPLRINGRILPGRPVGAEDPADCGRAEPGAVAGPRVRRARRWGEIHGKTA
jgi:hypothetical protein